jgi:hypothetical protein
MVYNTRYEIFIAGKIYIVTFWTMTRCSLMDTNVLDKHTASMFSEVCSYKTLVPAFQSIRCRIPGDHNMFKLFLHNTFQYNQGFRQGENIREASKSVNSWNYLWTLLIHVSNFTVLYWKSLVSAGPAYVKRVGVIIHCLYWNKLPKQF